MIFAAPTAEARPFTGLMDYVAQGFEALGAAILVLGVIWSVVLAAMAARRSKSSARAYLVARQAFGGTLLLGLDITHRGQRPGPGTDRGNQDIPEFLAGNRDQGRCAMAAGDDERRGDHPSGRGKRSGFRDAALTPFTLSVKDALPVSCSTRWRVCDNGHEYWTDPHDSVCVAAWAIRRLFVIGRTRPRSFLGRSRHDSARMVTLHSRYLFGTGQPG